jgi:nucleotide-binding universal stress UspA family protein
MKQKSFSKAQPAPGTFSVSQAPPQAELESKGAPFRLILKHILVPIDFSECSIGALDYAVALAQKFQARLLLLHVVEPTVYRQNPFLSSQVLGEGDENLITAGREQLAGLRQRLQGIPAEVLVRVGRAESEIPDTAKATGSDLIVMGRYGSAAVKQAPLGGTAERVVRQASCPVLTVRQA